MPSTPEYRPAPWPSEGPELMVDGRGREVLRYMFASFVFTWPKGSSTVYIEHGKLSGEGNWKMPEDWAFSLPSAWSREALAVAARNWHARHTAKFRR